MPTESISHPQSSVHLSSSLFLTPPPTSAALHRELPPLRSVLAIMLVTGEKDTSSAELSVSSAPLHSAQTYCKGPPSHCMHRVGGEDTVSLTVSGIPKWWEGWTMGTRSSLENPVPPVQCSTPARSIHAPIYNSTATMALSTTITWPHSTSAAEGKILPIDIGSFSGVQHWGNLSNTDSSSPWVQKEQNDL